MPHVALPHEAPAGPTKPEVRAVAVQKLDPRPEDHVVEVGCCTGAVTVELGRRAASVTALDRDADRVETARKNVAANDGVDADLDFRAAEAPEGLPADADALFVGGTRNFEAALDWAAHVGVRAVVMNVSRLEVAAEAVAGFRERDLLEEVLHLQVSRGYDLAGATSFEADNPVYVIVGSARDDGPEPSSETTTGGGQA